MKVMIVYHTKTGHTLEAANALAEGIRSAGSEVDLVDAKGFSPAQVAGYDALIAGSPCWFGSVAGGIATPVNAALESLDAGALQGKKCAEFVAGPTAFAGVPLSVVKGPSVSAKAEDRFRAFGAQFVA